MFDEAKLHRFSISRQDFEKAKCFLNEAKNHEFGGIVHEALVFSAIICYWRPFSPNEKKLDANASSSLTLSDFSQLSDDELSIHETCKTLRNKALAHAEFDFYPTSFNPETGIFKSSIFSLVGKVSDLDSLVELIEKLMKQCDNKRAEFARGSRNP